MKVFYKNNINVIIFIAAPLILLGCGSQSSSSSLTKASGVLSETLYVCATGDNSDPSDGTCAHAFNAIGFSTAANWGAGANKISAGDTVIVKDDGGAYRSTFIIWGSGTAEDIIIIQAESGDEPIIDGNNAIDYGIRGTDKEYISISGLTIMNLNESGVRFDNTTAKSTLIFDDITCDNVGQNCIWIEGLSGNLFSNVIISDSVFSRWSQEETYGAGDNKEDSFNMAAIAIKYANGISIAGNKIDIGVCSSRVFYKCGSNAIVMIEVTNAVTEYNEIKTKDIANTPGGHGVYIKCVDSKSSCTGTGNITRYNYMHDMGDDCYWSDNQTNNPLYYGNICINIDDDCTDIRGTTVITGTGKVYNNTCINFNSAGIQTSGMTAVEYNNNVYITPINGSGFPYFVYFEDPQATGVVTIANSTFSNNIYYNSLGPVNLEAFVSPDMTIGTIIYNEELPWARSSTFENWQAAVSAPDISSSLSNPNLNSTTGDYTEQTVMPVGVNLSGTVTQLLNHGATWSVGASPSLSTVSTWHTGAFNIPD